MAQSVGRILVILTSVLVLCGSPAGAQVTPAPERIPPDDTPSVRVGGTLFADYTYTFAPKASDAEGRSFNPNAFNVGRAYLNVTGQLNHLLAFRITPDIVRETGSGSSLNGRMTVNLKYGYVQLNLDDWLWRGTYVRTGMMQTPYVDFEESIYRYRFQGTVFSEREGYLVVIGRRAPPFARSFPGAMASSSRASSTARASPAPRPTIRRRSSCAARSAHSPTPTPRAGSASPRSTTPTTTRATPNAGA